MNERGNMLVSFDDGQRMRDHQVQPDSPPCWHVQWLHLPEGEASVWMEFTNLPAALNWALERTDEVWVQHNDARFLATALG